MKTTETPRLMLVPLTPDMAGDIFENSRDEDVRRFVPDEYFETPEEARETVEYLITQYGSPAGPQLYAVLTRADRRNIGYVQMVPMEGGGWEIGYHIGSRYTGSGYATEAVQAFLPAMAEEIGIREVYGICLKENAASCRVLEKCGFERLYEGPGQYQGRQRDILKTPWRRN